MAFNKNCKILAKNYIINLLVIRPLNIGVIPAKHNRKCMCSITDHNELGIHFVVRVIDRFKAFATRTKFDIFMSSPFSILDI